MLSPGACRRRVARSCAVVACALMIAVADCGAQAVDADQELVQLMQRLSQRQHGHVGFVERHFLAILDRPVESSGELFYDAPDHLEKRTLKPKPERLVLERGGVSVYRGGRSFVLSLRDHPQIVPFIDSIRAMLSGDLAVLNATYTPVFTISEGAWLLVLLPRDAKLAAVLTRIQVSGAGDSIHTIEYDRPGGDHSVMTISPLPDS